MVVDALSRGGPVRVSCVRRLVPELVTELTRSYIELVIGRLTDLSLESSLSKKDQWAASG